MKLFATLDSNDEFTPHADNSVIPILQNNQKVIKNFNKLWNKK